MQASIIENLRAAASERDDFTQVANCWAVNGIEGCSASETCVGEVFPEGLHSFEGANERRKGGVTRLCERYENIHPGKRYYVVLAIMTAGEA